MQALKTAIHSLTRKPRTVPVITIPDSHPSDSLSVSQNDSENLRRSFLSTFFLVTLKQFAERFNSYGGLLGKEDCRRNQVPFFLTTVDEARRDLSARALSLHS